MSTREERALIESLERHIATTNDHLDTLRAGLANARRDRDRKLMTYLKGEIGYYSQQLAQPQAQRAQLAEEYERRRRS